MRLHVVIAAAFSGMLVWSSRTGYGAMTSFFFCLLRVCNMACTRAGGEGREEASVLHDDMNVWLGTHALGWVDVGGALWQGICWDSEQISRAQVEQ